MNQIATSCTRPFEVKKAKAIPFETAGEKAFTVRAFGVITLLVLMAWIVTG